MGMPMWRIQGNTEKVDEPSPTPEPLPPAEALPYVEQSHEAQIICSFDWPQGCAYWIALAYCESTLEPYAVGYAGRYIGLFQVWVNHGFGYDWLLDPYNNTLAAWRLSDEGTYTGAWPYCQWQ